MANTKSVCIFLIICCLHIVCFANSLLPNPERKILIITGASGELGGSTARLLAQNYDLILTGRDLSKLKSLQNELGAIQTGRFDIYPLDYTSVTSREAFRSHLCQMDIPLAGLVLITPRPTFMKGDLIQSENVWLQELQSCFTGPLEVLKAVLPFCSDPGKVVVISGTTSVQLQPEYGPACVIRRMWTTYSKALAYQLGPKGISVNALSPGIVLTSFHEERIRNMAEKNGLSFQEELQNEVSTIPLQRHAKPLEVAQTIKFLISEQSDFINGINLILDGGYTTSY